MGLEINGQVLETDEEGFLLDPSQWNREVAEEIARGESLELDEEIHDLKKDLVDSVSGLNHRPADLRDEEATWYSIKVKK